MTRMSDVDRPARPSTSTSASPAIRRARPDERAALHALWERSVRASHDFISDDEIALLRPLVAELLAGDALEWWVLGEPDDAPLGFMGLAGDAIEALFLEPSRRGQGGGAALVAHAQRLRGGALTVEVNEENAPARRFYERMGFVVVGRSPHDGQGLPHPLLRMRRDAPPD